jgi:hypothetical protein
MFDVGRAVLIHPDLTHLEGARTYETVVIWESVALDSVVPAYR